MQGPQRRHLRIAGWAAAAGVLMAVLIRGTDYTKFYGEGAYGFLFGFLLEVAGGFLLLGVLCALICGLAMLCFAAGRQNGISVTAGAAAYLLALGLVLALWPDLRPRALAQVKTAGQPVVQAILAYEREHGAPPPDLEALVPRFLAAVPGSGLARGNGFSYYLPKEEEPGHRAEQGKLEAAPPRQWQLSVNVCESLFRFSVFAYDPEQRAEKGTLPPFPRHPDIDVIRRDGDWVYLLDNRD